MTKLKNTKKGMAKKALSVSLVAAMLATSNVPVWAAEDLFTDGSAAVEAPVVEEPAAEVETFSSEPAEEVNDAVQVQAAETGTGYSITTNYTAPKSIVWGGKIGENATVTVTPDGDVPSNIALKAVWKADDLSVSQAVDLNKQSNGTYTYTFTGYTTTVDDCDKNITLYVYAEDTQTESPVWSYTSDATKVDRIDIAEAIEALSAEDIAANSPTYNGKEQKLAFDKLFKNKSGNGFNDQTVKLSYSGDFINVTDEGVTVTLEANTPGYKGYVTANYKIKPMVINGTTGLASATMEATLVNQTYTYTGKNIKVKKDDVKLVDKATKSVDLSNYLYVDEDGYVGEASASDVGNKINVKLNLIIGQPTTGCKNYIITDEENTSVDNINVNGKHRTVTIEGQLTIVERNLSSVNVSIPAQTGSDDGKPITIKSKNASFTDKTTGEVLDLADDVVIQVPGDAIGKGTYTATIKPSNSTKNVIGETTASFNIVAADISSAKFDNEKAISTSKKPYTGEQITFTAKELGSLKDNAGKVIDPEEYEITFGTNINAVEGRTNEGVIIVKGKGSYEGSEKRIYFDIVPAKLDENNTKANGYVERIDTQDYSAYADAMGIVVKAKNDDGKEFTLKEGTDYTVKYDCDNNSVGEKVEATITIINDNFKGGNSSCTVESEITARAIKDENIKFRKTSYTYTGKSITPEFDVVIDGKIINPALYTAEYTNNVNAGTATVEIVGKGTNYSDKATAKATFTISPESTSNLEGAIVSQEYTGYSLEPSVDQMEITLNGEDIDITKDFTITYGENVEIGEGTVTLTPKNGNFTGTKTFTFQITGEMLDAAGSKLEYYNANGVKVSNTGFTYDGTAHSYAKTVFTYGDSSKKLVEGTDYEIRYVDNVYGKDTNGKEADGQKGAVLVIAKGLYGGDYDNAAMDIKNGIYTDAEGNKIANVVYAESFDIKQLTVSKSNVAIANATYAGGLPVKPIVTIIVNGRTLVEGTDYDLDLTKNDDLTQTTTSNELNVTIRPKNGYKETSLNFNWGIDKFNLANADVSADGDTVTVKCGRVDVETSEYTVTREGSNLTVTAVEGSKNYTGSKTINVEVEDEKPAAPVIAEVNVSGNNATVVLSGESDGATGYDYVISTDRDCINNKDYDKVNKNILSTETTFTYTQQGVYYAYCHAWKRVNGEKVFSDWSNAYPFVVSAVTPEQPVITSVKKSGRNLTVTWTQSANATTGYDVVMGTAVRKVNGELRPVEYGKAVKKVGPNTFSVTFKSIPKGTYYVGLHAHNRTSETGVKVFSPWSNYKTVKF